MVVESPAPFWIEDCSFATVDDDVFLAEFGLCFFSEPVLCDELLLLLLLDEVSAADGLSSSASSFLKAENNFAFFF